MNHPTDEQLEDLTRVRFVAMATGNEIPEWAEEIALHFRSCKPCKLRYEEISEDDEDSDLEPIQFPVQHDDQEGLIKLVLDQTESEFNRTHATVCLFDYVGDQKVQEALISVLDDPDKEVGDWARDALLDGILFATFKQKPRVLVAILEDTERSFPVRAKAADLLAEHKEICFVKVALQKATGDEVSDVREAAKGALGLS